VDFFYTPFCSLFTINSQPIVNTQNNTVYMQVVKKYAKAQKNLDNTQKREYIPNSYKSFFGGFYGFNN